MIFREKLQLRRGAENQCNNNMYTAAGRFQTSPRGRGGAAVKGCFLIAQLEVAFVKSKFYLFKMAPWSPPKMHGMRRIKTQKNAINSPSRRSGEITDKVLSIIHTGPNLARINACPRRSSALVCMLELVWG